LKPAPSGDGIVSVDCGEECDPPGAGCSFTCTRQARPLGTRRLTFGGSFYSSPLGDAVSLGTLLGELDIEAGVPDDAGLASLAVTGPTYYSAAILGGTFGHFCVRVDGCTGVIDCDGGSPVDVAIAQDSAGPGIESPADDVTGLGTDSAGAVELRCQRVRAAGPARATTAPARHTRHRPWWSTHGTHRARTPAPIEVSRHARVPRRTFQLRRLAVTDGPGQLAGAYLQEENEQAGDVANINVIDD
jgi:hypothetical protein